MSERSAARRSPRSRSSAAGSRARTSQPRARAPGSAVPGPDCGPSSGASSASCDPASSSSKTSPAGSGDGCLTCGTTCTLSATVRLPSRFLPSTSARPTAERECSLSLLPTPTAARFNGGPHVEGKTTYQLEEMARRGLLPTPKASRGNAHCAARQGGPTLPEVISGLLPTPTVKGNHNHPGAGERSGDGLATVAAPDGTLSPRFVEWLMGFPDGWTDCEPLAMPLFPSAPKLWEE
jgi:hypothetical protein